MGNIDVTHILTEGSRAEVEQAVDETIRKASGGGFILAPAHTHADINVRNVGWMMEAARRGGRSRAQHETAEPTTSENRQARP